MISGNLQEDIAAKWLLESGVQNDSKDERLAGGFNGWFDASTKSYPFIYSEITGYGMSSLIYLWTIKNSQIFSDRAKAAAMWIINNAVTKEGGVLTKYYYSKKDANERYSFDSQNTFAFDAGMVLYGLCNVALGTNSAKIENCCGKVADFLISNMQKKNGEFHAVWNTKTNEPLEDDNSKWSTTSGSYHAKLSLGFIAMHELTGDKKYLDAAERVCESSLKFQESDGRFITHNDSTHLHPHCYSAEGLLFTGLKTNRVEFVGAAAKAAEWAMSSQKSNGGIPYLYENGKFSEYERTDILAQTLRLASALYSMKILQPKKIELQKLRNRLTEFQLQSGAQTGGIKFGFDFDGSMKEHVNSWCTMFAMQAFYMNSDYFNGKNVKLGIIV